MPPQCNIDAKGKAVRLVYGIVLAVVGVVLIFTWARPSGGWVAWTVSALLIYNSRRGQFIFATTGLTPRGEKPANILTDLKPTLAKGKQWKDAHPNGKVMLAR